jgi:hypothetical protein
VVFALPEYELAFALFIHDTVRELARARSPLLSMVQYESKAAGVASRVRDRSGLDVDLPERRTEYEMTISVADVRAANLEPLVVEMDRASETLASNLVRMITEHISAITEAAGNVVHVDGPLTFEKSLEMMESIEWGLDDDGNLSVPSIVLHPEAASKLPQATPEQLAIVEDLKRRKYEEALARRRNRRLS